MEECGYLSDAVGVCAYQEGGRGKDDSVAQAHRPRYISNTISFTIGIRQSQKGQSHGSVKFSSEKRAEQECLRYKAQDPSCNFTESLPPPHPLTQVVVADPDPTSTMPNTPAPTCHKMSSHVFQMDSQTDFSLLSLLSPLTRKQEVWRDS